MRTAFKTHGPGGYMAKAPLKDIKQVWIEFKKTKSEKLRNTLMENYPPSRPLQRRADSRQAPR